MHIQNATNKTDVATGIASIEAVIDGTFVVVPLDPANRHYAEIMRQVADEGLVIAEPD